jgi:uncharacterized membrane protein
MPSGFNAGPSAMIPTQKPRPSGARFPFIGVAVAVLGLYAILAVAVPPTLYRSVVAIAAFFAMGYCALALIAGDRLPMSSIEILAFTVGLTILITSLSALAVSIVGIPITEFAVVIIGLPLAVIAFLMRRPSGHPWRALVAFSKGLFDFSDYSTGEKGVVAALFIAVVGALVFLMSTAALQYPVEHSVALAITGPGGDTTLLNGSFAVGVARNITVTVLGYDTPASYTLRIRLVPVNATGSEPFHPIAGGSPLRFDAFGQYTDTVAVAREGTWERTYSIAVEQVGSFFLRFALLDSGGATIREAYLPVQAR